MDFLPIFMNVKGLRAIVVGGGEVAARKTGLLLEAGASVTIVSPELGPTLARQAEEGTVTHRKRAFMEADLDGCAIVIAATDDEEVNRQVSQLARTKNIPVNVVDNP